MSDSSATQANLAIWLVVVARIAAAVEGIFCLLLCLLGSASSLFSLGERLGGGKKSKRNKSLLSFLLSV